MAGKRAGKQDQARKKSPTIEGHTNTNTNNNSSKKNSNTNAFERREENSSERPDGETKTRLEAH